MSSSGLCTFLPWDSDFFGVRIARLDVHRLDDRVVSSASEWCRQQRIACLYVLSDPDDSETTLSLERWNAHMTDIRVTLQASGLGDRGARTPVRKSNAADLPELRNIARDSHRDGRFFFDPRFSRERCESFYETWIARSHEGFADAVLVAELNGDPAGYVTCHVDGDSGRIGLFAVGATARGQGLGKVLVGSAAAWFAGRGIEKVSVVTQGRNTSAQRLYARCGFELLSVSIWYHKWFVDE